LIFCTESEPVFQAYPKTTESYTTGIAGVQLSYCQICCWYCDY